MTRRILLTFFAAMAMMTVDSQTTMAQKTAKVVYVANDTIMTFYYDENEYAIADSVYQFEVLKDTDLDEDGDPETPEWITAQATTDVTTVIFDPSFADFRPTTCHRWFFNRQITSFVGMKEYLNTSDVTNMSEMFSSCGMDSLDLSSFNTEKVTDMSEMFMFSVALKYVDLSSFKTNSVKDMSAMFAICPFLETLDLSSFNTKNVENMSLMFTPYYFSSSLTTLTLGSGFDMTKAEEANGTDMMFYAVDALTTLNLKGVPYVADGTLNGLTGLTTVNYILDDETTIYTGENYLPEVENVTCTYTRNNIGTQWGTIVVPFAITPDESKPYGFYEISSVGDGKVVVSQISDEIAAGTPVILGINADEVDGKTYDLTLSADEFDISGDLTGNTVEGVALQGTYESLDVSGVSGYYEAENSFWSINSESVLPFHAYLAGVAADDPDRLDISLDDDTATAIDMIEAAAETNGAVEIHDLMGRRLDGLRQGVNIVKFSNGETKKVIIK